MEAIVSISYLLIHCSIFQEKIQSEKKVIVAVRQGNLLGTAFHPELTADTRWYMYFDYFPLLKYFYNIIPGLSICFCRHSYFLKMANDVAEGASTSIIAVGVDLGANNQPRNDLPIYRSIKN